MIKVVHTFFKAEAYYAKFVDCEFWKTFLIKRTVWNKHDDHLKLRMKTNSLDKGISFMHYSEVNESHISQIIDKYITMRTRDYDDSPSLGYLPTLCYYWD